MRKTLSLGVGRDHRADVAALGNPVAVEDQLALFGHQRRAHVGIGGDDGRGLGDLGRPDRLADVAPVEQHRRRAPGWPAARVDARRACQLAKSAGALGQPAAGALKREQGDGAVHRPAVQVGEAERTGELAGDRGLAGTGGAVDGDQHKDARSATNPG